MSAICPAPDLAEVGETATRTTEPIMHGASDWLAALDRTAGQCECQLSVKGHQHRAHWGNRCPVRHGANGGRLYLTEDGPLYCSPCSARVRREIVASAPAEVADSETLN
jgi:hypothetical protein